MENNSNRVMVVSAHPDDIDFGCNGTVAKWIKEGAEAIYVICTKGDKGTDDPEITPEDLTVIREEEQRKAAKVIGVKEVIFLGFEDGELKNDGKLRKMLVRAIRTHCPRIVMAHDPANRSFENIYLSHIDHRNSGEAAFDAVFPAAGNPNFFPELTEEGLAPHKVSEIYFFGTRSPNQWIDITGEIDLKIQALSCHKSQLGRRKDWESFIRNRFREVGLEKGFPYAECFRRLEVN